MDNHLHEINYETRFLFAMGIVFLVPSCKKDDDNTDDKKVINIYWTNYSADLISKRYYYYGEDDSVWIEQSESDTAYILGFKLIKNDSSFIGWMKFDFDIGSGSISLIDKAYTDADALKIQW